MIISARAAAGATDAGVKNVMGDSLSYAQNAGVKISSDWQLRLKNLGVNREKSSGKGLRRLARDASKYNGVNPSPRPI
jgi:hypothetical protein